MAGWLRRLFGGGAGRGAKSGFLGFTPSRTQALAAVPREISIGLSPPPRSVPCPAVEIAIPGNGTFEQEVVGESHYQAALRRICGPLDEDGAQLETTVHLVFEDDNPHDNQAVRVQVAGERVGYLSRTDARRFRAVVANSGAPAGAAFRCNAEIRGGFKLETGGRAHLGIFLDFHE